MTAYRSTAPLHAVPLDDGTILLKSDLASCRIEGESATLISERVLPMLTGWRTLDAIMAGMAGYGRESVAELLQSLVRARLLISRSVTPVALAASGSVRLLADLGIDEVAVENRLARARIGVIGSTRLARAVHAALADAGVTRITAFTLDDAEDADTSDAMPAVLSRQAIASAAADLDLMIAAVDEAFLAARHWVNRASLESGCPAIFLDVAKTEAIVGPTVLPGETGCYMCFRMRHIATSDTFTEVMAHERYLDTLRDRDTERECFPGLDHTAIGVVLAEAFRLLFGPLVPALPNAVLHIDALSSSFKQHSVLRQPDCPHCRSIDTAVRLNRRQD